MIQMTAAIPDAQRWDGSASVLALAQTGMGVLAAWLALHIVSRSGGITGVLWVKHGLETDDARFIVAAVAVLLVLTLVEFLNEDRTRCGYSKMTIAFVAMVVVGVMSMDANWGYSWTDSNGYVLPCAACFGAMFVLAALQGRRRAVACQAAGVGI